MNNEDHYVIKAFTRNTQQFSIFIYLMIKSYMKQKWTLKINGQIHNYKMLKEFSLMDNSHQRKSKLGWGKLEDHCVRKEMYPSVSRRDLRSIQGTLDTHKHTHRLGHKASLCKTPMYGYHMEHVKKPPKIIHMLKT